MGRSGYTKRWPWVAPCCRASRASARYRTPRRTAPTNLPTAGLRLAPAPGAIQPASRSSGRQLPTSCGASGAGLRSPQPRGRDVRMGIFGRAWVWGLIGFALLMLLYLILALLGWPGDPDSCTLPGGNCYCEAFPPPSRRRPREAAGQYLVGAVPGHRRPHRPGDHGPRPDPRGSRQPDARRPLLRAGCTAACSCSWARARCSSTAGSPISAGGSTTSR